MIILKLAKMTYAKMVALWVYVCLYLKPGIPLDECTD